VTITESCCNYCQTCYIK